MRFGRNRGRRLALFGFVLTSVVAGAAVLSHAWQIHALRVEGVQRFEPQQVHEALREVLGKSPFLASAQVFRQKVLTIPWVLDAQVEVELDGTVVCRLQERVPAAVLADETPPQFVDSFGRILGPAPSVTGYVQLLGFGPYPDERREVLRALPELTTSWGKPVRICQRLGTRDLAVTYAEEPWVVVVDPHRHELLSVGKQVLANLLQAGLPLPQRLDVRLPGRVFVQLPEEEVKE